MGGRGSFSFSAQNRGPRDYAPLSAFAVASLNKGSAKGTTVSAAIDRFREQLMDAKVEYSGYIDDSGYVHALGSTGREGETKIAPLSAIARERGVSTIIHNHPHGGSDGRKWGGPLSSDDLMSIANLYSLTRGRVNRIVATAREGTYSAKVRRNVSALDFDSALKSAEGSLQGKRYPSEKAMWRAMNSAYTSAFGKIGIDITFTPQKKRKAELKTVKTGEY